MGLPIQIRRYAVSNVVILAVDMIVSVIYSIFYGVDLILALRGVLPALLLMESGVLFLTGGFAAYGGTIFVSKVRQYYFKSGKEWTPEAVRKGEKNAFFFVALASILLAESLIFSI
ncbi:MAG: hypothetical protein NTV15_08275 [Candidatus Bathyarchaeota archaeon]|nr:hypothetical protein [Candidatus Bathyarchaeota archaeon]